MSIEPFEVSVDEQVLQDLEDRIRNTRWADDFDNADWEYGTNGKYLKELCDFWVDGFDWREQEREINQFAPFQTTINDLPIHFIHEKGRGPNSIPLILTSNPFFVDRNIWISYNMFPVLSLTGP